MEIICEKAFKPEVWFFEDVAEGSLFVTKQTYDSQGANTTGLYMKCNNLCAANIGNGEIKTDFAPKDLVILLDATLTINGFLEY